MELNEFQRFALDKITEEIDKDPLFIGVVQDLCNERWAAYVQATKDKRESEHIRSLQSMLHKFASGRIAIERSVVLALMDGVRFVYPKGFESCGCEADTLVMWNFTEAIQQLGWKPDDSFIRDIREYSDYLAMIYEQFEKTGQPVVKRGRKKTKPEKPKRKPGRPRIHPQRKKRSGPGRPRKDETES